MRLMRRLRRSSQSVYLACVFAVCSASVSHLSAISMKSDFCREVRAASANRMHSAALLRSWSKLGKCASISVHMGTDRALCLKNDASIQVQKMPARTASQPKSYERLSVMSHCTLCLTTTGAGPSGSDDQDRVLLEQI